MCKIKNGKVISESEQVITFLKKDYKDKHLRNHFYNAIKSNVGISKVHRLNFDISMTLNVTEKERSKEGQGANRNLFFRLSKSH